MKFKIPIEVTVASGLSQKDATAVLQLCGKQLDEFYSFSMVSKPSCQGWDVVGRPRQVLEQFLKEPELFYVEYHPPIPPQPPETTFDEYIAKFKSGEMNIHRWNCCISKAGMSSGNEYYAYIMAEGAEQMLTRKKFPSEQAVRDLYVELGVTKHILWI